ncbi:hypothetical protein Tco_0557208 [Tanacetum coccineum]
MCSPYSANSTKSYELIHEEKYKAIGSRRNSYGRYCLQVFVGGLDPNNTGEHLKQLAERSCDEETLRIPQGTQFGGETVKLSCGHSLASNQSKVNIDGVGLMMGTAKSWKRRETSLSHIGGIDKLKGFISCINRGSPSPLIPSLSSLPPCGRRITNTPMGKMFEFKYL